MKAISLTGISLFVLWAASWALSYAHAGFAVALLIAAAKALLVALFFMELVHARTSVRLAAITAVGMIATLVTLVAADVLTR